MKPPADAGIAEPGWAGLDAAQAPDVREPAQAGDDLDRLIARVFGNAEGKKLLEWLRETYVEPAVCQPGVSADFGFYREGQRYVVIDLETRLTRATRPPDDNSRKRTRSNRGRSGSTSSKPPSTGGEDPPF